MKIEISEETILTADSVARVGAVGAVCGLYAGPRHAEKLGLNGLTRTAFVAKKSGHYGFRSGVFGAVYFGSEWLQIQWGYSGRVNDFISCIAACSTTAPTTRYWKSRCGVNCILAATCALISIYRPSNESRATHDMEE